MFGSDACPPLLLVEDGPLALLSTKAALEDEGYRVVAARHGVSAMMALDQPIAALITDIRLPGPVDGWEIGREARNRWPDIPVMYVTGEGEEHWPHRGVPGSLILHKPFSAHKLIVAVERLMGGMAAARRTG